MVSRTCRSDSTLHSNCVTHIEIASSGLTDRPTRHSFVRHSFVDEKASGRAVDDYVVARCNKEQQTSTELNRAAGKPLVVKHLKTDLLRYFAWGVWGSIPHCCKAIDSTILSSDLLPSGPLVVKRVAASGAPLGGTG